ncbi:MAG: M20/M25/M40 family metallo-hydrolase [Candidatus Aminicenantes bacterium]|nr:M20/M25/M40 family metallo-hydrolase [Candidatus Aminicenantes bacterium]
MKRIANLLFTTLVFLFLATLVSPVALSSSSAAKRKVVPRAMPDGGKAFAHIKYLASDKFQGRKSGTPEYRKAAEYVAAEMEKAGLKPGGENGTWFQEVPFKNWTDFEQPIRLEVVSPERRVYFAGRGRDFTPVSGTGSGIVKGGLVFAGYGVVSEKDGWNDYAALDVKGKIVLVMPDLPASLGNDAKNEWNFEKKVKTAAAMGALGLIEMDLTTPREQAGPQAGPRSRPGFLRPGQCPEGFVVMRAGRDFLSDVFYLVEKSWRDMVSKTLRLKKSVTADLGVTVEMEAHFVSGERTAPNVIGVLPGNDPKLKDEALVIGGHLDHLGVGVDGWVYPGADDNAGSAAVILETARALAAAGYKPARTIVFGAWAGEELGLQGSRYYTEHPVIPLEKTALYMNIDMVGTGDSDLLVGGMTEFAELYEVVKRGLDADTIKKLRPRPNYRGSDHTSFWGKNVPAISLRTGEVLTEKLDDEHPEYHLPGDRPETIDPELLRLACQYHADILQSLGSSRENLLDPVYRTLFLHREASVVDMHCDTIARFMAGEDLSQDLPKGHIDIPKLKRGAVDLEVFACFAPPPANEAEKYRSANGVFAQIEAVNKLVEKNPGDLALVRSVDEANAARNASKTGVLIAIEGGYAIENDLVLLREFYRAGVRLMTLTHWTATDWADASGDPQAVHRGLTDFGESVVREMNRLGMVIDVSHAHDETFWDVIRLSKVPVVASHSGCRALSPHHRNLSDEMLKALAENGGVVGICFVPAFLQSELDRAETGLFEKTAGEHRLPADRAAIEKAEPAARGKFYADFEKRWAELKKTLPVVDVKTVVDHIDHVVKVTGDADHVGLGSDFDGTSDTPVGLGNVGLLPNITKELVARGYKPEDIRKILGGNFLRVFGAVERAREK